MAKKTNFLNKKGLLKQFCTYCMVVIFFFSCSKYLFYLPSGKRMQGSLCKLLVSLL